MPRPLFFLLLCFTGFAQKAPIQYVNPLIGSAPATTQSARLHSEAGSELKGQISPAVGVPHGMTTWTPQTQLTETKCIPPYYYNDTSISGFRATHWLNGSCVQDYGTVTLMPFSSPAATAFPRPQSSFSHRQETVTPSYYSVELPAYSIKTELTATARAGMLRFTFEKGGDSGVFIQPNSDEGEAFLEIHPERNEVVGYNPVHRIYQGAGQSAGFSGHFVIQFDTPLAGFGIWQDGRVQKSQTRFLGTGAKQAVAALVQFMARPGQVVTARVGTSFVDAAGARRNLLAELPPQRTFAQVRQASERAWNGELSRLMVTGSETDKTKFYTALYHAKLTPRLFSDTDGRYPGFAGDSAIHRAEGFDYYCDFSLWDTFRAAMPLHVLLEPERSRSLMESLTKKAEQGGWMPIFPCWNSYTAAMIGDHVLSVMADAYGKGVRGFDVKTAYRYLRKNAFDPNSDPRSYAAGQGRRALASYLKYNFIPLEDSVWQAYHKREQTSRTLEYAYDDFCLAQLARAFGHTDDENALLKRAKNYRNVIDPQVGWARGRHADGTWSSNFNPFATRASFITEGSPAQYTWFVPHDVAGLMQHLGGRPRFVVELDTMAERGRYWHGNEPGHHTAYLYAWAGQPYKTQRWVRSLIHDEYSDGPGGLSGNEDGGQLSAWLVFSMAGFYPVCPGTPVYVLGSPAFEEVTLRLPNKKTFTIRAAGNSAQNVYIQSAMLNGKTFTRTYLTHDQLLAGGMLQLTMGPQPNKTWGSADADLPPNPPGR